MFENKFVSLPSHLKTIEPMEVHRGSRTMCNTETSKVISRTDPVIPLRQFCGLSNICEIQTFERKDRNEILEVALINGVGVRQLARLTGVSYGIIQRLNEKMGQRTVP